MVEGVNHFQHGAPPFVGTNCFWGRTRTIPEVVNEFKWVVFVFAMMAIEAMFVIVVGMAIQGQQGWNWKLLL